MIGSLFCKVRVILLPKTQNIAIRAVYQLVIAAQIEVKRTSLQLRVQIECEVIVPGLSQP